MKKMDDIKSEVTNILTIDVEDWYMDTDISTWASYEDRIVQSTQKILEILEFSRINRRY
jgi:hypothetical protein